ncbi:MAG: hypothetical protein GXO74_06895 [Calditrichaeota bacterium]|nr:hypothetical protein [Calditrichota bacterium]
MPIIEYDKGIRISGTPLWLDAEKRAPLSFISHAHSDHVRRHDKIIATPATISLVHLRYKKQEAIPLNFGESYRLDDATIELFPAGHVLGSAQIFIQKEHLNIIYTGDFKIDRNETTLPAAFRSADILIMESTFGSPEFRFPKKWVVIEKMAKFIEKCFQRGQVPIVMGYRLGKAQEAIKILGDLNYQISVHGSIEPVLKIYEKYGVQFNNYQSFNGEDLRGRVLVIPPHLSRSHQIKKIYNAKKLLLSGWAVEKKARYWYDVDEAIPFSDHADFQQLIEYAHKVNPQKIFVTHGVKSFVHDLRREGFDADFLHPSAQMSLF